MENTIFRLNSKGKLVLLDNTLEYYNNANGNKGKSINLDEIVSIINEIGKNEIKLCFKKKNKVKKCEITFDNEEECDRFFNYFDKDMFNNISYQKTEYNLTQKEALQSPLSLLGNIILLLACIYGAMFISEFALVTRGSARIPVILLAIIKVFNWIGIEKILIVFGIITFFLLINGIKRFKNPPKARRIEFYNALINS
ncbi:MAG: hypothetical protein E7J99_14130 [Clostridium butyricum]|uniref:hypothetical protein n=1 Tax=Clostridium butyricum TaxID=1492 RepID=UPI00290E17FB|nr:hypothetical protein [Clostridium butyricum]